MPASDFLSKNTSKATGSSGGASRFLSSNTKRAGSSLNSTEGLRETAQEAGLDKQLGRIKTQGEAPKEIYSGGWISDTFDTLNALQYGVSGVIKGTSFKEGVRTRQSFTDKDALGGQGGVPFMVGLGLDILTDPLTYVGGLGIVTKLGKISGATAASKKAVEIAAKTSAGKQIGRHLVYRFGQDPVYAKMSERAIQNSQREVENIVNLTKKIQDLDGSVQREITRSRELGHLGAKKTAKFTQPNKHLEVDVPTTTGIKIADNTKLQKSDFVDIMREELIDKARKVKPDNLLDSKGKVDLEGFEKIETFLKKADKGTDTGKDLQEVAEAIGKISGKKLAPKINLTPEQFKNADQVFTKLDELSTEFAGLMFKPTSKAYKAFIDNVGTYMRRSYRVIEESSGKKSIFPKVQPMRADAALTKMRKDIPDEILEALDEIREAGYPTAKVMVQLTRSIENLKFFKSVDELGFAADKAMDGLKQLPKTANLGALSGKYVPEPIFDDIQEIIRTPASSLFDNKVTRNIVGTFKFSKVILNPATHIRNMISNLILNNFEGLSPARLDIYAKAAYQIKKKGKIYQEARKHGLGLDSFAANELNTWLDPAAGILKKTNKGVRENLSKISDLYQKEEEWAKMAQYIFQKSKGLPGEEAWKIAERATFNYAQVTPTIRRIRESIFGYPFVTFTYKVTPQVIRTMVHRPTKISNIGKIKNGIENQIYAGTTETSREELERSRASEPDWVRNGFYLTLPFKDDQDRVGYLDLTYILPFGDLVTGAAFEADVDPETGLQKGPAVALVNKLAFVNVLEEIVSNQDFFGNKIFKDSDPTAVKMGDIFRHLTKTMTPPLVADQIPGGVRYDGTRRPGAISRTRDFQNKGIEGGGKQTRNVQQELLRTVGIKINPIDIDLQENYAERNEQRAIKTILGEAGVTGEFDITYLQDKEEEDE